MADEVCWFVDDQQIVVVMNDLKKVFHLAELRASGLLLRTRGSNYLIVGESPARKTLVTPRVWRIMPVGERKVESLAASDFDAGFCPHPLARVASAQFQ